MKKKALAFAAMACSVAMLLSACGGSKDAQTDDAQGGDDGDAAEKIVIQVGYGNNPQYFSHVFKKATGMTPSAYIKFSAGGNLS